MYLTYDEYLDMGGADNLDEQEFEDIEFEARSYIDWYTFDRLTKETELSPRVKQCMYHIIKLIRDKMLALDNSGLNSSNNKCGNYQILSQSNDDVSVSYNVMSTKDALDMIKDDVDKNIRRYLQGVTNSLGRKLLYRGIYPDE